MYALIVGGCATYSGPLPEKSQSAAQSPTSRTSTIEITVRDRSTSLESAVGTTRVEPERILQAARRLIEPHFGPMDASRNLLRNNHVSYTALSPRYDEKNLGNDYSWTQVNVQFDPNTSRCTVDVVEKHYSWRPFWLSAHGGLIPFPMSVVRSMRTEKEKRLLLEIMQRLGDPTAEVADRIAIRDSTGFSSR